LVLTSGLGFVIKETEVRFLRNRQLEMDASTGEKLDRILSELNLYTIHDVVDPACHILFGTEEQKNL
jgi:hypothetical protein